MKRILLLSLTLLATALASPIKIKDTKGREITVTIINHTKETVTFEKGAKKYTVPWGTFDEESIKLIKVTPLPGAANKRPERLQKITLDNGKEQELNVPAGDILNETGILDLYIGDQVHLEFKKSGGVFSDPKIVASVKKPEQTITLSFQITEDGHTLTRTTQIQQTVALDCYEMHVGAEEFSKNQSFFPTEKGQKEEQTWSKNVWHLQLRNIAVTTKPAADVFQERNQ